MGKFILYMMILIFVSSCSDSEKEGIDCALVDCFGADVIQLTFIKSGQNIFEIEAATEVEIIQNDQNLEFTVNNTLNIITIFLLEDDPITIKIDNQELTMEISSTFLESECCSGIKVDSLKIRNSFVCVNEECEEVVQINLD